MAQNGIGAGKVNVSGSVSESVRDDLRKLADASNGVGISTYMVCLMIHAVEKGLVFPNAREMKGRAQNVNPPSKGTAFGHALGKSVVQQKQRKARSSSDRSEHKQHNSA